MAIIFKEFSAWHAFNLFKGTFVQHNKAVFNIKLGISYLISLSYELQLKLQFFESKVILKRFVGISMDEP